MVKLPTQDDLIKFEGRNRQKYGLPNCIGSIDGTFFHRRQPPTHDGAYHCYKKFYSIVVLCIVDPDFRFISFNAGAPGSAGDAQVWNQSNFNLKLCNTQRYDTTRIYIASDGSLASSTCTNATPVDSYLVGDAAFRFTRRRAGGRVRRRRCWGVKAWAGQTGRWARG
jgi:hypothetical protein